MHWYLVPLDYVGNLRGPRHFKWRGDPAGLNVPWNAMDFGAADVAVVVADTDEAQHAALAALDDCFAIGDEITAEAVGLLQVSGVETGTLEGAPLAEQRHRLLALAQAYQAVQAQEAAPMAALRMAAPIDVAAIAESWAEQPIHFGIAGEVTRGPTGK
mgnify:FL=1